MAKKKLKPLNREEEVATEKEIKTTLDDAKPDVKKSGKQLTANSLAKAVWAVRKWPVPGSSALLTAEQVLAAIYQASPNIQAIADKAETEDTKYDTIIEMLRQQSDNNTVMFDVSSLYKFNTLARQALGIRDTGLSDKDKDAIFDKLEQIKKRLPPTAAPEELPECERSAKGFAVHFILRVPWYLLRRIWHSPHFRWCAAAVLLSVWSLSLGLLLFVARDNAAMHSDIQRLAYENALLHNYHRACLDSIAKLNRAADKRDKWPRHYRQGRPKQ